MNTPSKTVYFLGAGFSKAVADLPTINEFLQLSDFHKSTQLEEFIEKFFKKSKFTIEDLLTYIDIGLSKFGEELEAPLNFFGKIKEVLNAYIVKRLYVDFQRKRKDEKFNRNYEYKVQKLKGKFKEASAILTLNYDCIVEGILEPVDKKIIKMIKFLSSSTERFSKEETFRKI